MVAEAALAVLRRTHSGKLRGQPFLRGCVPAVASVEDVEEELQVAERPVVVAEVQRAVASAVVEVAEVLQAALEEAEAAEDRVAVAVVATSRR